MRTIALTLMVLLLVGCTHQRGAALDAPDEQETRARIDREMGEQIASYEKADAAAFVAECTKTGEWRSLSCVVLESQFTTFPGLTQAEIKRYIIEKQIPYECIDYYGITEGIIGESLALRSRLREVREAYAARVNRAVIAEIEKRPPLAMRRTE